MALDNNALPLSLTYGLRFEDNTDNKVATAWVQKEKTYIYALSYFVNLALAVHKFKGDFEKYNLPIEQINKEIMLNGSVAFCSSEELSKKGFEIIAMPYTVQKYTLYGCPQEIKITPYVNGINEFDNMFFKNTTTETQFVIVYCRPDDGFNGFLPQATYTATQISLAKQLCNNNVLANSLPLFIECIDSQTTSLKNLKNLILNQCGIVSIDKSKGVRAEELIKIINSNVPWLCDKAYMYIRDLCNEYYRELGIKNVAYEKKERVNTEEVKSLDQVVDIMGASMLNSIQSGLDKVNNWKKTNFKVEKALSFISEAEITPVISKTRNLGGIECF